MKPAKHPQKNNILHVENKDSNEYRFFSIRNHGDQKSGTIFLKC